MASLGEDLRSFLIDSTAIAAASTRWTPSAAHVVEQNAIPQNPPSPRIWFQRESQREQLGLDGNGGLIESDWDLEVLTDLDGERFDIADAVKTALNGFQGTLGARTVFGVFVDDHDDDYIPRGLASEEGEYVAALRLTVIGPNT